MNKLFCLAGSISAAPTTFVTAVVLVIAPGSPELAAIQAPCVGKQCHCPPPSYTSPSLFTPRISRSQISEHTKTFCFSMFRIQTCKALRAPRTAYTLCSRIQPRLPYSSGSPAASTKPYDYFNKTGRREASDPIAINMRSDEYSKSGGDDIVADQVIASFKVMLPAPA